jgi:ABC-type amino acid transport system permease subunit
MASTLVSAAVEVESFALNAIVGSLFFTASLSVLDLVRFWVSAMIQVPRNTGSFFLITALLTTLLAVLGYMAIKFAARNVTIQKPGQIYALTR